MTEEDLLDIVVTAYEEIMENESFPLEPYKFSCLREPGAYTYRVGCNDRGLDYLNRMNINGSLSIFFNLETSVIYFIRKLPIIAGKKLGELEISFGIDMGRNPTNREEAKLFAIKAFDEYQERKTGLGGEIIREMSNLIIKLSRAIGDSIYYHIKRMGTDSIYVDFTISVKDYKFNDSELYSCFFQISGFDNKTKSNSILIKKSTITTQEDLKEVKIFITK
mgnify:FL=1